MVLQEKTAVTESRGCPETWGAFIRTIKPSSGRFTYTTTFGHQLAAACDDGTVSIYDTVMGKLRLSLRPADAVQVVKGSPNGSMLFCAHQPPSITAWDIQTGGLVHTFLSRHKVEDMAISLTGRYLACGSSDGSVKIWEVANRTEVAVLGSGSSVVRVCWVEPEEQLVVARKASVQLWDVVTRKVLRNFTTQGSVRGVIYSQKLNKFAILAESGIEGIITVVDSRTGASVTNRVQPWISCFAFSQNTKDIICGTSSELNLFSVSLREWRQFDLPVTVTSISTLPNGTVVADVTGSGIQLLSLSEGHASPQQPAIPALTVCAFDQDNIIAISSSSSTPRDIVTLLESVTMSPLLTIPTPNATPPGRTAILCASLEHRIAVHRFESHQETYLEMWGFGDEVPRWTESIRGERAVGEISPSGSRLVALHKGHSWIYVYIWDTRSGLLEACRLIFVGDWCTQPLGMEFGSEDEFYSIHDVHRTLYIVSSSEASALSKPDTPLELDTESLEPDASSELDISLELELETVWVPGTPTHLTIHSRRLPMSGQSRRYYEVDETREWVVGSSKRICWIPPDYIGSNPHSYCWAGHRLLMAGRDETLRTLTFREPC